MARHALRGGSYKYPILVNAHPSLRINHSPVPIVTRSFACPGKSLVHYEGDIQN